MGASDDRIQAILRQIAEENLVPASPIVLQMFGFDPPPQNATTVKLHRWVLAEVFDTDSTEVIRTVAKMAVDEMGTTSTRLAMEMVFGGPDLLPETPLWTDGLPLFASKAAIDGAHRFGVEGGNIVESADCFASDVASAIDRLTELAPSGAYDSNDDLEIYCSRPMVMDLMRAWARVGQRKCKVFGLRTYDGPNWLLTGPKTPCGLEIRRPDFELPTAGTRIMIGARFRTWIVDPRRVILVKSREK